MKKRLNINWKKLIISLLLPQLAGGVGALFTAPNISSWYSTLNKPSFVPPSWLFAPAWTLLYILMGISLYLIWNSKPSAKQNLKKTSYYLWGAQLILNSLWSILFFGLQNPLLGLIEIIILWITILLTIINFYKHSKKAAYLLIPYILWVTFASALNLGIFLLN